MAKKPSEETRDEAVERATLERHVVREEAAEASLNERVADVFSGAEPQDAPVSPVGQFLEDARACQGVYGSGNVVSPDELKSLVNRAVGLLSQTPEQLGERAPTA